MFLSHVSIEKYIEQGLIVITGFEKKNIRPVGVRVHLAKEIFIPEPNQTVSITDPQDLKYKEIDLTREEFYLEPGQFVLGATLEAIQTPSNILVLLRWTEYRCASWTYDTYNSLRNRWYF